MKKMGNLTTKVMRFMSYYMLVMAIYHAITGNLPAAMIEVCASFAFGLRADVDELQMQLAPKKDDDESNKG